ncbi:flagellar hook assembly protein FlgD [Roseovarius sp. LXJ103]|uniref:flagellar hook capping FlgD N-terminal domain-containing protein n=1 Tax=Roseovarius carneus TaxID=2853164 RepID=UPI000D612E0A|nr:flagellar hook capping FlgD N-terminal domain-containing protein [Roseovarius carneus]MBZ8117524.1 flagellar hook assembly protein FlgD [Roseovarius carneus]PWE36680.1 flagellar basal body rod modification protein [Pelagicola sp. LXJ1103]
MDLNPTNPTASIFGGGASAAAQSAATTQANSALSSDFETFLKMLTAQMQNQDPLNPVDSTEFASQLAQFSSVEQQVRTNDLLAVMGQQLGIMGMGQLQGWVGMTARAEMPVAFQGAPVEVTLNTAAGADLARLVVRDARGGIVAQQDVPPGGGAFTWNGRAETGNTIPAGSYELSVDSFQGEELLGTSTVESQARIVEARLDGGTTVLVMEGGALVPASGVLGLRNPDGA